MSSCLSRVPPTYDCLSFGYLLFPHLRTDTFSISTEGLRNSKLEDSLIQDDYVARLRFLRFVVYIHANEERFGRA